LVLRVAEVTGAFSVVCVRSARVDVAGDGAGTSVDFFAAAVVLTGVFFAGAAVFVVRGFVVRGFVVRGSAVAFLVAGEPGDSVCAFDIELTPVRSTTAPDRGSAAG